MALNINNTEVERLATEVARLAGESKTEAIRQALLERRSRLRQRGTRLRGRITPAVRRARLLALEREVWSRIPEDQIGRSPDRSERERILGYGEHGA